MGGLLSSELQRSWGTGEWPGELYCALFVYSELLLV